MAGWNAAQFINCSINTITPLKYICIECLLFSKRLSTSPYNTNTYIVYQRMSDIHQKILNWIDKQTLTYQPSSSPLNSAMFSQACFKNGNNL